MLALSFTFVNSIVQKLQKAKRTALAGKIFRYLYNRLCWQLKEYNQANVDRCWLKITQQAIAEAVGVELRRARRALEALIDMGLLVREPIPGNSGKGWRYKLVAKRKARTTDRKQLPKPKPKKIKPPAPPESERPFPSPSPLESERCEKVSDVPEKVSERPFPSPPRSESERCEKVLDVPERSEAVSQTPESDETDKLQNGTFAIPKRDFTHASNPCAAVDAAPHYDLKGSNINTNKSTEKKLTSNNKLVIPEKRQPKNPLPKPTLKREKKIRKVGIAKDSRWGQISREFDKKFREMVGRYLTDACRPEDIAACAAAGIDRERECRLNDTVIDYCVRAGIEIVRQAISICNQELRSNTYIKKPAAFLVHKLKGLLAGAGLLTKEEFPRHSVEPSKAIAAEEERL